MKRLALLLTFLPIFALAQTSTTTQTQSAGGTGGGGSGTVGTCGGPGNAYYSGAGTTVACDTSVTDNGSGTLAAIAFQGAVAATTLSASSTVSGTGFTNYFASPPAIGVTAPAAGTFTIVTTSSATNSGYWAGVGNTANYSVVANSAGWMGPPSASFTAWVAQLPATGPGGSTQYLGCSGSGVATCAWNTISASSAFPITVSGAVTSGGIPYFNSTTQESSSAILNTNILVKGGGAGGAPTNSSITDNGTTIASSEPLALGTATCTTFGTAGGICPAEGTAPTNVSGAAPLYPDATAHEYLAATNGSSSFGMMVRRQPGAIHATAQTAAISTATLCAASAGACNVAGQYHVHWNFTQGGTACTVVTAGSVTFLLTWTDTNAVAHSAIAMPMFNSVSNTATSGSFTFTTNNATAYASGDFNISTNGAVIQYATGYTACTTGTGTYQLDASVTRLQ